MHQLSLGPAWEDIRLLHTKVVDEKTQETAGWQDTAIVKVMITKIIHGNGVILENHSPIARHAYTVNSLSLVTCYTNSEEAFRF
jgi:hypothetical protein